MMRFVLENIRKNGWKALENVKTDTESKGPKSWTKKYDETRAAAWKIWHVKIKQSCTKHQKYYEEILQKHEVTFTEKFLVIQNTLIR